ncbi:hypothetical protein N8J89_35780 [Crossiella sp. CA-258035]|uniref:hypothetical protein n=1 Tax=Crossiella sp. CA-258035 TaxID=2981138 RepID=UPI0024BCA656|nr:hypothetical protein [Crossiella sp. CA-258035]WHT18419.1 hypothetical protein N8J89_35780 [Crossiella sp. CA-258035]
MDNLPAELRERLLRLNAELLEDQLRAGKAVWLACDLLVAGAETPAVVELAGESPTRLALADAAPTVRQMLAELGVEPIDASQAPWAVARDVARGMIVDGLLPEDGAHSLWQLFWSCDNAKEIALMHQPLEAWAETLPAHRDDEVIRAELRELAQGVVRAAVARLAADGMTEP